MNDDSLTPGPTGLTVRASASLVPALLSMAALAVLLAAWSESSRLSAPLDARTFYAAPACVRERLEQHVRDGLGLAEVLKVRDFDAGARDCGWAAGSGPVSDSPAIEP